MKNKVCAAIITYNIDEKIIEVVNSIIEQVECVLIIDNNSKNETISILKRLEKDSRIELILNSTNEGIAKALNQGIKVAKLKNMEWLLTLDHDSICDKNMVENMIDVELKYKDKSKIAILTPKVFDINKQKFISSKHFKENDCIPVKDCIQSGAIFKMGVFDKIGKFNEDLFIYHVDFEFCERVIKAGFKILQCNNVTLYHEEGYKIEKNFFGIKTYYNNYSSIAIYYITRNTIYMAKNYSIFYIKRIIKDFVYILLFDKERFNRLKYWKKGILDAFSNRFGKLNE